MQRSECSVRGVRCWVLSAECWVRRLAVLLVLTAVPSLLPAQATHTNVPADSIKWQVNRDGSAFASLEGDPRADGQPFSLMMRMPDGYWIRPHTHPVLKHVMVISGTLLMGHGERLDPGTTTLLGAGSFSAVPAGSAHYEGAKGETVVLFYGIGPLTTKFLEPRK